VSPGLSEVSCVNDAEVAPVVVSQTSPDDLLTDQTPPSAANDPEHPASAIARASAPRIPIRKIISVTPQLLVLSAEDDKKVSRAD
jgi:hypothetical protein